MSAFLYNSAAESGFSLKKGVLALLELDGLEADDDCREYSRVLIDVELALFRGASDATGSPSNGVFSETALGWLVDPLSDAEDRLTTETELLRALPGVFDSDLAEPFPN